jgi:hypothetical protein
LNFAKKVFSLRNYIAVFLAVIITATGMLSYYSKVDAASEKSNPVFSRITEKDAKGLNLDQWIKDANKLPKISERLLEYSDVLSLNEAKRHIMKVQQNNSNVYFVYYPISGKAEKDSHYILTFDEKGAALEDYLILGLKNDQKQIRSIVLKNNLPVFDTLLTEEGKIVSGSVITSTGEKQSLSSTTVLPQGYWSCLNDCLASQGIAAWAITTLSILCGVACAATAGAGCLVCLLAADITAGSVVGYCSGQCSK